MYHRIAIISTLLASALHGWMLWISRGTRCPLSARLCPCPRYYSTLLTYQLGKLPVLTYYVCMDSAWTLTMGCMIVFDGLRLICPYAGIRVYGMTCIQGELLLERRSGRVNKSPANHPPWTTPAPSPSVTTLPRMYPVTCLILSICREQYIQGLLLSTVLPGGAPWGRLKALLHNLLEHVQ